MALHLTDYANAQGADHDPTLDALGVARELSDRNLDLRDSFKQSTGWSFPNKQGVPGPTDGLTFGDLSAYPDTAVELARYNWPTPVVRPDRHVEVRIYVYGVTDANVTYTVEADSDHTWTPAIGANGWHSFTGIQASAGIRVTATVAGTTAQIVGSVCVFTSRTAPTPSAIKTLAQFDLQTERPHDAGTMRAIDRLQNRVADSYPQARGAHWLGDGQSKSASQPIEERVRYRFWRGLARSCTLFVLVETTGNGPVLTTYVTPDGGSTTTVAHTLTGTGVAWKTYTLSAASFTENTEHELAIGFEDGGGNRVRIQAVVLAENTGTYGGRLVSHLGRYDEKPTRLLEQGLEAFVPGSSIVASYRETERRFQGNWGDVRTMLQNALYNVLYSRQTLVLDWCQTMGGTPIATLNKVGIADGTVTLARWQYYGNPNMRALRLFLLTSRVTTQPDAAQVRAITTIDGVDSEPQMIAAGSGFGDFIEVAVPDDGAAHELQVKLLYTDALGNPSPSGDPDDVAYLSGLFMDEQPLRNRPGAQYFYGETSTASTPDNNIPDNSGNGRTKTISVGPSFQVKHVRVFAAISHAVPFQLTLRLTHPNGVTHTDFMSADWTTDGSGTLKAYSDNIVADIAVTGSSLETFAGMDSAGDWVLKVSDGSAGTTGTFDAFGLELT